MTFNTKREKTGWRLRKIERCANKWKRPMSRNGRPQKKKKLKKKKKKKTWRIITLYSQNIKETMDNLTKKKGKKNI